MTPINSESARAFEQFSVSQTSNFLSTSRDVSIVIQLNIVLPRLDIISFRYRIYVEREWNEMGTLCLKRNKHPLSSAVVTLNNSW
jgi:hypothetical protein